MAHCTHDKLHTARDFITEELWKLSSLLPKY